jgi:hypothetical protein
MPKAPTTTLAWSPVIATYEIYQTRDRGINVHLTYNNRLTL